MSGYETGIHHLLLYYPSACTIWAATITAVCLTWAMRWFLGMDD